MLGLASRRRREIAQAVGRLAEGETRPPEPERHGTALERAGERNLMGESAAAVAKPEE